MNDVNGIQQQFLMFFLFISEMSQITILQDDIYFLTKIKRWLAKGQIFNRHGLLCPLDSSPFSGLELCLPNAMSSAFAKQEYTVFENYRKVSFNIAREATYGFSSLKMP